ncbi:MAG: immunoglobulin-like domain-containing protein, partial [Sphingomonadales bacterium]
KVSVVKSGTVDPYTLGTYTETYTATDESGNTTTVTRTVNVVDRIAPQILAPAMNVCVGTPFWAMSGLVISDNYYSPSTLSPLVSVLNHNINIWEAGVYYINYTLTDPSGNKAMMVTRPVFVNYPPNCQNTYLSTANVSLDEAVSVFPNPTSGKVTLSYMLQNNKPVSVEVFNVSGSKVASFNNLKSGLGHTEINLAQFGNGVYMIRLSNDGQTTTKRVVVRN